MKTLFSVLFLFIGITLNFCQIFVSDNIGYRVTDPDLLEVEVLNPDNYPFDYMQYNFYSGQVIIPSSVVYENKTYNVTAIGSDAFYQANNVTGVTIPNSVKTLRSSSFAFSGITSITIPSSVTTIEREVFGGSKLTSISVPSSVTSIGDLAFADCNYLTTAYLSPNITVIPHGLFARSAITSINIPSGVTSIGSGAFYNCTSLTTVNLPSSVNFIENNAFENCNNLTMFTCGASTPPVLGTALYTGNLGAFYGTWQSNCYLYVPAGSVDAYSSTSQWKDFKIITTMSSLSSNEIKSNAVSVFPNPAKDFINVSEIPVGSALEIYDMTGKLVYSKKVNTQKVNISTTPFKNGLYLIKVNGNVSKLIISK